MPRTLVERVYTVAVVHRAYTVAVRVHAEQVDKAGQPYVMHVLRVAERIANAGGSDEAVAVALLHDTVEDCPDTVSLESLRLHVPPVVVEAVDALTHRKGESRPDYRLRVKANPLATLVKVVGDIPDNTNPRRPSTGDAEGDARRAAKYAEDLLVLSACAYPADFESEHDHNACVDALVTDADLFVLAGKTTRNA